MTTTARYDYLLSTIPPGLHADIAQIMRPTDFYHRITRAELAKRTGMDDRQNRDVIPEIIATYHIAILSESGRPGYWLAYTKQERDDAVAELLSRANELVDRANALRACVIPSEVPIELPARVYQESLF